MAAPAMEGDRRDDEQGKEEIEAADSLVNLNMSSQEPLVCWDTYYRKLADYYAVHPMCKPWCREYMERIIEDLRGIRNDKSFKKSRHHYEIVKRYQLMETTDGDSWVVRKPFPTPPDIDDATLRRVVPYEEIYDKLNELHLKMGHGRRTKMLEVINQAYIIPRICCETFLELCRVCLARKGKDDDAKKKQLWPLCLPRGDLVELSAVPPEDELHGIGQVDVVDMSHLPDGDYNFLLRYEDLGTKFLLLRPLKSNLPATIAGKLLKIFLHFDTPHTLQSCSGGNNLINHLLGVLQRLWPSCKIINGSRRSSSKQQDKSFPAIAQELEEQLRAWMQENTSSNWSKGCHFVQWQKNNRLHSVIGRTPYAATFANIPKSGIRKPTPLVDRPKKPRIRLSRAKAAVLERKMKANLEKETNRLNEPVLVVDKTIVTSPRRSGRRRPAVTDAETSAAVVVLDAMQDAMTIGAFTWE